MERRGLDCASLTLLASLQQTGCGRFFPQGRRGAEVGLFTTTGATGAKVGGAFEVAGVVVSVVVRIWCGWRFPAGGGGGWESGLGCVQDGA